MLSISFKPFLYRTNSLDSRCYITISSRVDIVPCRCLLCTVAATLPSAAELTLDPAGGNLLFPTAHPSKYLQHLRRREADFVLCTPDLIVTVFLPGVQTLYT